MSKEKKLKICYLAGKDEQGKDIIGIRYVAEKWQWKDSVMGEQFITFSAQSENPINFQVGDYCVYRGETFTLNYIPSETQSANPSKVGNGFVYDSVKFDSRQEELTRCQMRDITASTGLYKAALGTNYTGSTTFSLYCGEATINGNIYTPVCVLAAKMQANLDAMYKDESGNPLWSILVNTTTTHDEFGKQVYDTHTDEKVLSFSNNYVSEALAMVYNTFKLNYCVRGRKIYIGYKFGDLTTFDPANPTNLSNETDKFSFGYGKGIPSKANPNKGLFQMKKISNSSQMIVTRLRAFGSKKNMPYRYYNKKYNLSQSMFPVNLMLPSTFKTAEVKASENAARKTVYPTILDVKGDTNDSYIEKGNNALSTNEGIREGSAFWDGSNDSLEEIYPTIEGTTYGELRCNAVPDQDGTTGSNAFPNYDKDERIDEILEVCNDANVGTGINFEGGGQYTEKVAGGVSSIGSKTNVTTETTEILKEREIARFDSVESGNYIVTYTLDSVRAACILKKISTVTNNAKLTIKYIFDVSPKDGSAGFKKEIETEQLSFSLASSTSVGTSNGRTAITYDTFVSKVKLPYLTESESLLKLSKNSSVKFSCKLVLKSGSFPGDDTTYQTYRSCIGFDISNNSEISLNETSNVSGNMILKNENVSGTFEESPFHIILKDIGFDITKAFYDDDTARISIKSGNCVAREFEIGDTIEKVKVTRDGKEVSGYKIQLIKRATDDVLNAYFPSKTNPLKSGDRFVLLGIEMPDVYVDAAEMRLLKAACEYIKENGETKFTYQPSIDDIFVERDYDKNIADKTPEKSIYWRLYAGLKFTFREIPKSASETSFNTMSVMIQSITIKEGEKYTPQIDITLNDDIQQTTLQKIQSSVSKIENSSSIISLSGSYSGGQQASANVPCTLSSDLVSSKSIGNVMVGDKFVKGTTLEEVIRKLLTGESVPVVSSPTFEWITVLNRKEYGKTIEDVSAKVTLNSATSVKAIYVSIDGQQEEDITANYSSSTGYVTYHKTGTYKENMTYAMRCVFVYNGEDYPITISQNIEVVKPRFYGKFSSKKTTLTATEIKTMTSFIEDTRAFALSGGNTIAFAVPDGTAFSVTNVTEDGVVADWTNWNSQTSASSTTENVQIGDTGVKYKVYLAYSESGFGEVKGTIKIS